MADTPARSGPQQWPIFSVRSFGQPFASATIVALLIVGRSSSSNSGQRAAIIPQIRSSNGNVLETFRNVGAHTSKNLDQDDAQTWPLLQMVSSDSD
jgi:hypothetical protein